MADSRTYHDVLRWREDQITKFYIDHRNHSFSANIVLAFVCLPVLGLMVPGARMLRRAIFAITACLGVHIICNLRIIHVGNGYLIGLMASTWILHIAVLLLLSNPERDFRRLEYTQRSVDHRPVLRLKNNNTIHWQPYPGPLPHRLSWVLGLLFSMRGPTWNWRIDTLRPLPAPLQSSVLHPPRSEALGCYIATVDTCASLLLLLLKKLVIFDILVSFTRRDPYFWGILQTQPLPESPMYMLHQWPLLIRTYRMLLCYTMTVYHLTFIATLRQLLRRVIALAGLSPVPYDQPWLNTPLYGNISAALESGLAGFWGSYWHQLYRFDCLTCSAAVLSSCPSWIRQHVIARRVIRMLVTFFLVGVAHSCACYTSVGLTLPVRGVLLFFMLQTLGIILQTIFLFVVPQWLRRPRLGRVANFVYVFLWFLACAPLAFDEYASGGLYIGLELPASLSDAFLPLKVIQPTA